MRSACTACASALDTGCGARQDVPNTAPVWLSEIGLTVQQFDPADGSADDTRWWRCLRAWMARHDIDWGFWALQVRLSVYQCHVNLCQEH